MVGVWKRDEYLVRIWVSSGWEVVFGWFEGRSGSRIRIWKKALAPLF